MSSRGFSITYSSVTPESAEDGENSGSGFIDEDITLRDAHNQLECDGDAVSANCWPMALNRPPRWIDFAPYTDMATGEETTKSLHFPRNITPSSAMRVARLFGLRS